MSRDEGEREVACSLSANDSADRRDDVQARLRSYYLGYEPIENGLEIMFEGTDDALVAVSQFVAEEQECCSFAEYQVHIAPPYDETALSVTGPEGTRQLFRTGLIDHLEDGSA